MLDFGAALHAEKCVCGVVVVALRAQHRHLFRELLEQRLGVTEVGSVAAFSEPSSSGAVVQFGRT